MPTEHFYREGQPLSPDHAARTAVLIEGQMDLARYLDALAHPDKRLARVFADGIWATEDASVQLIFGSWIARHEAYWNELNGQIPVTCFGLDVARSFYGDRTVLAAGSDVGLRRLLDVRIPDVTEIVDWVLRVSLEEFGVSLLGGRVPIAIDYGGGYGSGVGDLLRRRGAWVIEFQPGSSSRFSPRNFGNLRTEAYALLGMRLDPQGQFGAKPWALPSDDMLRRELTAPEKVYASDMVRFSLQPKDEIKQKMAGHSPDLADATTYLFHAVRILHNLDEYFRSYERPPVIWPVVEPGTKLAERLGDEREREREKFLDEWRREELRPEFAGLRLLDSADTTAGKEPDKPDKPAVGPAGTGNPKIDEFVRFAREMYGAVDDPDDAADDDRYGHLFGD